MLLVVNIENCILNNRYHLWYLTNRRKQISGNVYVLDTETLKVSHEECIPDDTFNVRNGLLTPDSELRNFVKLNLLRGSLCYQTLGASAFSIDADTWKCMIHMEGKVLCIGNRMYKMRENYGFGLSYLFLLGGMLVLRCILTDRVFSLLSCCLTILLDYKTGEILGVDCTSWEFFRDRFSASTEVTKLRILCKEY